MSRLNTCAGRIVTACLLASLGYCLSYDRSSAEVPATATAPATQPTVLMTASQINEKNGCTYVRVLLLNNSDWNRELWIQKGVFPLEVELFDESGTLMKRTPESKAMEENARRNRGTKTEAHPPYMNFPLEVSITSCYGNLKPGAYTVRISGSITYIKEPRRAVEPIKITYIVPEEGSK